jgi:isopenicillin-N N-acyltransferase-like protein
MANAVRSNIEIYLDRFTESGLSRDVALSQGKRWSETIQRTNAEYYEEMTGIAEGAHVTLSEIGLLNGRYEIAFTLYGDEVRRNDQPKGLEDGCTTFGVTPDLTEGGKTWLCQNWDWLHAIQPNLVVTRLRRPAKTAILSLTEAGIVGGKMGLNDAGIGLVENGLASDRDGTNPFQNPFHVRCREILDADRFDQALLAVVKTKRTASANFMIGHADGEIVGLETSPNHVSYYYPQAGVISHSNHFIGAGHGSSEMERIGPSTLVRAKRAEILIRKLPSPIRQENLAEIARDHFCHPNGICRHPDERLINVRRTATLASVMLDLKNRIMNIATGQPCESKYQTYAL